MPISRKMIHQISAATLSAIAGLVLSSAHASPRDVHMGTAPLVSPSSAWTYYLSEETAISQSCLSNDTGCPAVQARGDRVQSLAKALNNDPERLASYVRENIEFAPMFGVQKGSEGALLDAAGTAFDQSILLADLLREAGFSASVVVGDATYGMSVVEDWLGTTSTTAIERILADGGIPAIVSGSSVTMLHAWVEASIDGSTVYYDPSVKAYDERAAENIKSLMGFTSGASLLSTAGATGTANFKKNINQGALRSAVAGFADTLADNLQSPAHRQKDLDAVLGIAREVGNHLETAATSAPGTVRRKFSGDVSEVFRTTIQISLGRNSFDNLWSYDFFSDELAGARIAVTYNDMLASGADISDRQEPTVVHIRLNEEIFASIPISSNFFSSWGIGLDINHPYAADSGTYMDETVLHRFLMNNWPVIAATVGPVSQRSVVEIEKMNLNEGVLQRTPEINYVLANTGSSGGEPVAAQSCTDNMNSLSTYTSGLPPVMQPPLIDGEPCSYCLVVPTDPVTGLEIQPNFGGGHCFSTNLGASFPDPVSFNRTLDSNLPDFSNIPSARYGSKQVLARKIIAQLSEAGRLHASIQGGQFQHHHSLGVIDSDLSINPHTNIITEDIIRTDVETSYSYNDAISSSDNRLAFARSYAATGSAVEGAVSQQFTDSPFGLSSVAMLSWLNEQTQTGGEYTDVDDGFYLINSTTESTVAATLRSLNANSTSSTDEDIANLYGYAPYLEQGYSIIMPSRRYLGPLERVRQSLYETVAGRSPKYIGYSFIAFKAGDPSATAHIVRAELPHDTLAYFQRSSKGGGAPVVTPPEAKLEISGDFLEEQFNTISQNFSVSTNDGTLTISPPADLKTGQGEFPYSLSYRRTYNSARPGETNFQAHGWRHDLQIRASIATNNSALFGENAPAAAASASVAAFTAMQEIAAEGDTLGSFLAVNEIANWWAEQAIENMVQLTGGDLAATFYRVPDTSTTLGYRYIPAGGTSSLTQTGDRVFARHVDEANEATIVLSSGSGNNINYVSTAFDYSGISFQYTGESGDTIDFAWARKPWPVHNRDEPTNGLPRNSRSSSYWGATKWTFPYGVEVTFSGNTISNNLGRSLTFNGNSVTDDNSRTVELVYEDEHTPFLGQVQPISLLKEVRLTHDGVTKITKYDYDGTAYQGDPSTASLTHVFEQPLVPLRNTSQALTTIHLPSDQTTPHMTFGWDDRKRVSTVTDKEGHQWTYDIGERAGRMTDPTGATSVEVFNMNDQDVVTIDPVGRASTNWFDDRGRVRESRTYGASDFVTPTMGAAFAYDHLDNQLVTASLTNETISGSEPVLCQRMTYETTFNYMATESDAYAGAVSSAVAGTADADSLCGAVPAGTAVTHYSYIETGNGISMASQMHVGAGSTPLGPQSNWTYDTLGRVTRASVVTDTGKTEHTDYEYDTSGYMKAAIVAPGLPEEGRSEFLSYTANGDPQQIKDPNGHITDVVYDGLRRIKTITAPAPTTGAFRPVTEALYDFDGRIDLLKSATGDSADPWAETDYTYQPNGRLKEVTDPDGHITKTFYDAAGRGIVSVDAEGRKTRTVYDAAGRVSKRIKAWRGNDDGTGETLDCAVMRTNYNAAPDPALAWLQQCYQSYTYTPTGQIETVTDAGGNVTTYYYDGHDRLAATHFPSKDIPGQSALNVDYELYTYDANGNMLTKRTRRGDVISYDYDALNRLVSKTVPGAPTHSFNGSTVSHSFTYDLAGRQLTATHDGVTLGWSYDSAGRMESATRNGTDPVSYAYDAAGNVTALTYPDGYEVHFAYDALNRVTHAHETSPAGRQLAAITYDALSRRTGVAYGNGPSVDFGYTKRGDLTDQDFTWAGASAPPSPQVHSLTYDFSHNGVGQLLSEAVSDATMMWLPEWSSTKSYAVNGLNQYESVTTGTAPATPMVYDGNGNLTAGHGAHTFTYDAENVLREVHEAGTLLASYTYGADNTRLSKSVSGQTVGDYWYTGDQEIMETDNTGATVRRYIRLPGSVDETFLMLDYSSGSTEEVWAHTNRLGSTIATTDNTGALIEIYTYDDYGNSGAEGDAGFPFRFTGQKLDPETGLMYYKARYYAPDLGRFLQVDPIGYEDQMNLYAYVHNDPLNKIDPSGTNSEENSDQSACASATNVCLFNAKRLYDKGYESESFELRQACLVTSNTCYANEEIVQNEPKVAGGVTSFPPNKGENGGGKVVHAEGKSPRYIPPTSDPIGKLPRKPANDNDSRRSLLFDVEPTNSKAEIITIFPYEVELRRQSGENIISNTTSQCRVGRESIGSLEPAGVCDANALR